jgi:hypothetical protein
MKDHARRLKRALSRAFDLGYQHGKPKKEYTGKRLCKELMGGRGYIGDWAYVRNAYSARIWVREMENKE